MGHNFNGRSAQPQRHLAKRAQKVDANHFFNLHNSGDSILISRTFRARGHSGDSILIPRPFRARRGATSGTLRQ